MKTHFKDIFCCRLHVILRPTDSVAIQWAPFTACFSTGDKKKRSKALIRWISCNFLGILDVGKVCTAQVVFKNCFWDSAAHSSLCYCCLRYRKLVGWSEGCYVDKVELRLRRKLNRVYKRYEFFKWNKYRYGLVINVSNESSIVHDSFPCIRNFSAACIDDFPRIQNLPCSPPPTCLISLVTDFMYHRRVVTPHNVLDT